MNETNTTCNACKGTGDAPGFIAGPPCKPCAGTGQIARDMALRLHLGSRHALANWRYHANPMGVHEHEHLGPGTIRNHDPNDLTFDYQRALDVEAEAGGQDGVAAVAASMARIEEVTARPIRTP